MYAIFHGPKKLKEIAATIHQHTTELGQEIAKNGHNIISNTNNYFDTIVVELNGIDLKSFQKEALSKKFNFMYHSNGLIGISLDEKTTEEELSEIGGLFKLSNKKKGNSVEAKPNRKDNFLKHPIFHSMHSETEMLRYMHKLEKRDLSLNHSMIPLGSCTMKLNATVEMIPISWPEFNTCLLYTSPSPRD